jgi:hypothetical protein
MNKSTVFLLVYLLLLLPSCSVTREWKSNDTPQGAAASFALFNGRTEYPVPGSTNSRFYVKFDVGLEKGSLSVILQSASGIVKDSTLTSNWTDSLVIDNPSRQPYRIKLRGHQASGYFTIRSNGVGSH